MLREEGEAAGKRERGGREREKKGRQRKNRNIALMRYACAAICRQFAFRIRTALVHLLVGRQCEVAFSVSLVCEVVKNMPGIRIDGDPYRVCALLYTDLLW